MNSRLCFKILHPNVIHENIDGEVVIVNLESGNYYSVENIGADIWDSIKPGTSIDEIICAISNRYEGDHVAIGDGIDQFISDLLEEELIAHEGPFEPATVTAPSLKIESEMGIGKFPFTAPVLNKFTDMQDLLLLDPIHEVDGQGWPHIKPEQNDESQ